MSPLHSLDFDLAVNRLIETSRVPHYPNRRPVVQVRWIVYRPSSPFMPLDPGRFTAVRDLLRRLPARDARDVVHSLHQPLPLRFGLELDKLAKTAD